MADANLNDEANYARLSRLLIGKGTEALRKIFDTFYSSFTLPTFLKKHHALLFKLKSKVINENQWDLLFPTSGNPDSKKFDISLLSVLLWSICGLKPPVAGWSTTPPDTDRSQEANIVRLRLYRNDIRAYAANTEIPDYDSGDLWSAIYQMLIDLGVSKGEIQQLRDSPLGSDEESYIEVLKEWKIQEIEMQKILDEIKTPATKVLKTSHQIEETKSENTRKMEESIDTTIEIEESSAEKSKAKRELIAESSSQQDKNLLLKLSKFNFDGDKEKLVQLFHQGTREWLLEEVEHWFSGKSQVFVLTAGPGVGKSVFAAKIIEIYKKKLAACHFCKCNNSNYNKPMNMIPSLASQICDSVKGFKEKLLKQLKKSHEVNTLQHVFQAYLKEPLQDLPQMEPMLVVIDGLNECERDEKTNLLQVMAEEFSKLPAWLKVLVTSRPEINVEIKLKSLHNEVCHTMNHCMSQKITSENKKNQADIQKYLKHHLHDLAYKNISTLTKKCQGSFLSAFNYKELYLQHKRETRNTKEDLPVGISDAYAKYFNRLKDQLKKVNIIYGFSSILKIIARAYQPIPLSFFTEGTEPVPNLREMKQIIKDVNKTISTLLYVSDESVTVFHRTVVDWLLQKNHEYTVELNEADKLLWEMMENKLNEARRSFENEKNYSSICSLTENTTMQYVLKHGFQHLFRAASYIDARFEWLVDVSVLHLITTSESFEPCFEAWRHFLRHAYDNSNSTMEETQRKVSWLYEHFSKYEVRPIYVQDIFNEGPEEIFSDEEKRTAKYILDNHLHFWCEKLGYLNLTRVTACTFSPDGLRLVSCADDGIICIWNMNFLQQEDTTLPVKQVSFICENAICCFWSEVDKILIYHYAGDNLMLSCYPVDQDSSIQSQNVTTNLLAKKSDTPLAFSAQAFIFKCSKNSSIKVHRFTQTNRSTICMPDLDFMHNFAITRDGSSILAADKDHFEIWNIKGTTSTDYNLFKSEKFELSKVTHKDCDCITEVLSCKISSNQKHGIISYLCSERNHEEPYILVIDMNVDRDVDDINLPYPIRNPTDEKLFFELIEGNNEVIVSSGDDDDNNNDDGNDDDDDDDDKNDAIDDDDSDTFYFVQSYKRITIYSNKCMGPLTYFNHNGDPDYYKESSVCHSGKIIALPQEYGGICMVKLHLPTTNWKNFGSRIAEFRWKRQSVSLHNSVL